MASTAPDWTALAGQIIEDAQAALGVPFMLLSRYDSGRQTLHQVAWGGLHLRDIQRGLRLIGRLLPGYDTLHVEVPVANNPYSRAVFLEGRREVAVVPIHRLIEGVAPPLVAHIVARVIHGTYGVILPLQVGDEVLGTITYFQNGPDLGEPRRAVAQAFARQVALSIHNAQLLEQQRAAAEALELSRQLVIQAQDHTRQEISELLHSRVQSRLLVVWHQLGDVQGLDAEHQGRLDAARDTLERLREEDVRRISHRLHPEGLQAGLVPAVQMLASTLAGGLEVRIAANTALLAADLPGQGGLPAGTRLVVFRALEEALSNALKHAGTRQVQVRLELHGPDLHAEVVDAGAGFDPAAAPPGLGLRLLGARIGAVGGAWGIESRPGGPTRLWLRVPDGPGAP